MARGIDNYQFLLECLKDVPTTNITGYIDFDAVAIKFDLAPHNAERRFKTLLNEAKRTSSIPAPPRQSTKSTSSTPRRKRPFPTKSNTPLPTVHAPVRGRERMRNHTHIDTNATAAVGHGKRGFASMNLASSVSDDSDSNSNDETGMIMNGSSQENPIKVESDDDKNEGETGQRRKKSKKTVKSEDEMTVVGDDDDEQNSHMPTPAPTPTPKAKRSHQTSQHKSQGTNRGHRIVMTRAAGDILVSEYGSGHESEDEFYRTAYSASPPITTTSAIRNACGSLTASKSHKRLPVRTTNPDNGINLKETLSTSNRGLGGGPRERNHTAKTMGDRRERWMMQLRDAAVGSDSF